jgi:hypothetical protein
VTTSVLEPTSIVSGNGWFYDSSSSDAAAAVEGSTHSPTVVTSTTKAFAWWDLQTQTWNVGSVSPVYSVSSVTVYLWALNKTNASGGESVTIDLYIAGAWVGPQTLPTNSAEGWVSITFSGGWNSLTGLQVKAKYADPNLWMNGCTARRMYVSANYSATDTRKYLFLLAMP